MKATMNSDGLYVIRVGSARVVSWSGQDWRAEYLEGGQWRTYPTFSTGPGALIGSADLVAEGRQVLADLRPRGR